MHSLFLRFFLSFWLIIGIIISAAATAGFWYAEQVRESIEDFHLSDPLFEASAALDVGGPIALKEWLQDYEPARGITLFIIDEAGNDLINRSMSTWTERTYRRHRDHDKLRSRLSRRDEPQNLRRSRHLSQLIGGDGKTYTFYVSASRIPESIWGDSDVRLLLLIFALLVSGAVSYALASAISSPVRKLRIATVSLADGDLEIRVADSLGNRRDELGLLGRDFDTMATKLQGAAKRQTELSRNISHELRSPLARIRVAVELARRKAGDLSEFSRLDDEAERLDSLIGQILSYTKLEASTDRKFDVVDLGELIGEVVENVNYECKADAAKGVKVIAHTAQKIEIRGHPDALISAFENVMRNAVRHSPPNGEVRVAIKRGETNTTISVSDSGSGVRDDDLPRLFEPFYRTRESSESNSLDGTGLGLAIARRAIELHRGQICARNGAEGGLVVDISLPAS